MSKKKLIRTLTTEGEKALGHIFGARVPVVHWTPDYVQLEGKEGDQLVFLVDWKELSDDQQAACLEYMSDQFGVDELRIRNQIESNGFFPIQHKYVIESYDLRHFI